jgi:hypothetical protein
MVLLYQGSDCSDSQFEKPGMPPQAVVGFGARAIKTYGDAMQTGILELPRYSVVNECAIGANVGDQTASNCVPNQRQEVGTKQRFAPGEGQHSDARIGQLINDQQCIARAQFLLPQDFRSAVRRAMHTMGVAAASDFPGDVKRWFVLRSHRMN